MAQAQLGVVLAQEAGPTARPTFWNIGPLGEALFYYLAAVTVVVFVYGVYGRFARYARGAEDPFDRLTDLPGRLARAVKVVATNEKNFDRDIYGGLMHTFIFWGFLSLVVATGIIAFDMDVYRYLTSGESFFVGDFYLAYSLVADAMGLLFVVGVGMAIYRRYWVRNERLWGKHTGLEDDLFVWALFLLGVGGYVTEGLRMLGTQGTEWVVSEVSFVGYFLMNVMAAGGVTADAAAAAYPAVWWSHALLAFVFIAVLPHAKPFHMLSSFANVVTHDEDTGARLPGAPADLDATSAESVDDFTWKELLDQDACTKCGRCSSACPAKASGRPLDPRDVILDLKRYRQERDAGGEQVDIVADGGTSVVDAHTMESCMACMACMDACPVDIEHLNSFTRMNRQLTDQGDVDPNLQDVFQDLMQKRNTFGESQRNRGDWADEVDVEVPDAREQRVEYLWYVGDYPSFDDRNKRVARSLAALFDAADVEFGILFDDEVYDGNDVRRIGEEFLYVELAGTMIDSFDDCDYEKIVCTDPHSFNTIKNEYPEVDFGEFADDPMMEFEVEDDWEPAGDVLHWTQVVEELVEDGRLGLSGTELEYTVTYHDPCHLGRYNDEYEAPRDLVRATGCELHEMPRNRDDSFCCGGGGGGVWMDFDEDPKPSEERLREALEDTEAGADVEKFVVACPQCMTMYEDGRKTGNYEDDIEVIDVAELLVEAVGVEEHAGVAAD